MYKTIKKSFNYIKDIKNNRLRVEISLNIFKQFINVFFGVYFLRLILNNLQEGGNVYSIIAVLAIMFLLNITFWGVKKYYDNVYAPRFNIKLKEKVNIDISDKIKEIPFQQYNNPKILDTCSRLFHNADRYINETVLAVGNIFGNLFALIMIAFYVVRIDAFALVISIIPIIVALITEEVLSKLRYKLSTEVTTPGRKKEYAKRVFYLPQYAKELRTTNISNEIQSMHKEGSEDIIKSHKKTGSKIAIVEAINSFFEDGFIIILSLIYIFIKILNGHQILVGDFVGLTQGITYFNWDLVALGESFGDLLESIPHLREYNNFLEGKDSNDINKNNLIKVDESEKMVLELKNVSYKYDNSEEYALKNINLKIEQGDKIAIVGENGSGKSTLIKIILGLLQAQEGSVTINNISIEDYDKDSLGDFFGVLLQDYNIYPFSVRDNITLGNDISDEDIIEALDEAGLSSKVESLDQMVLTEFDEDGIELSGGQKQNLALLRLITSSSPFIILDEPTSSLDVYAEQQVYNKVYEKLMDRTILFISHKLYSTSFIEKIIFLSNGEISEMGSHQDLINNKGQYSELYNIQKNRYIRKTL